MRSQISEEIATTTEVATSRLKDLLYLGILEIVRLDDAIDFLDELCLINGPALKMR